MSDRSIFGLISLAGNVPLDELRVRSGIRSDHFSRQLADLLGDGSVELSTSEDATQNARIREIVTNVTELLRDPPPGAVGGTASRNRDDVVQSIMEALEDDESASNIRIRLTTRGFKRSA